MGSQELEWPEVESGYETLWVHTFNSGTQEAEADTSLVIQGQPELHSNTLYQN